MDPAHRDRIAAAAARGAAQLQAGTCLDEVLLMFRADHELGPLESMLALRAIEPIDLAAAKELVESACAGTRFEHLGAAELRHLAQIPPRRSWLPSHLRSAIIDGRPWKMFVRAAWETVRFFDAATTDPSRAGSMHGVGISFGRVRDDVRAAASDPAWTDELRIVRDEPDLLLVHFLRVPGERDPTR